MYDKYQKIYRGAGSGMYRGAMWVTTIGVIAPGIVKSITDYYFLLIKLDWDLYIC
jgi:hypothetical protein